jgi:hypothetical protein
MKKPPKTGLLQGVRNKLQTFDDLLDFFEIDAAEVEIAPGAIEDAREHNRAVISMSNERAYSLRGDCRLFVLDSLEVGK